MVNASVKTPKLNEVCALVDLIEDTDEEDNDFDVSMK